MAIESVGATISHDGDPIGEVITISGPGGSASIIDITHLGSSAVEKLLGLPDEGQVTLECNYVAADVGQVSCRAARAARTSAEVIITLSDASTLTFDAYVMGFSISQGTSQQVKVSITLEIDGAVAFG